jgi:hypothetical protein
MPLVLRSIQQGEKMMNFKGVASFSPIALGISLLIPTIASGVQPMNQATKTVQLKTAQLEIAQLEADETVIPASPSSEPTPLETLPSSPDAGVTLPSPLEPVPTVPPQNTLEPIAPASDPTSIDPVIIDGVIPDPSAAPSFPSEFNQPVPNQSVPNLSVPTQESIN